MILAAGAIRQAVERGQITIEPFIPEHVNPNSYDFRLGKQVGEYMVRGLSGELSPITGLGRLLSTDALISAGKRDGVLNVVGFTGKHINVGQVELHITEYEEGDSVLFKPGHLYLTNTLERVGSSHYVPIMYGRSSLGRMFWSPHHNAGFGDLGFCAHWTCEVTTEIPLELRVGDRIGQFAFMEARHDIDNPGAGPVADDDYTSLPNSGYSHTNSIKPSKLLGDIAVYVNGELVSGGAEG